MDTNWVIVCGGPSRDTWKAHQGRRVACANATMIPSAELYVCSDPMAIALYAEQAKAVIGNCLIGEDARAGLPRIGIPCRTVGMLAVHHAIKRGATDIILCGIDGWPLGQMEYRRGNRVCSRVGANENMATWLRHFAGMAKISFGAPCLLWELVKDVCGLAEQGKH